MISCTHRMTNHSSTRNYIELKIFKPRKEKTSFKTRPGGLIWDPANPGLEPGWVEEKTGKEKIWCDLADPATRLTLQDSVPTR